MRSKSTRNQAFVSSASACQYVAGFPSLANRAPCPGASLLARVGLFRPKARSGPDAGCSVKRTYGRGLTGAVLPAMNSGSPSEVI